MILKFVSEIEKSIDSSYIVLSSNIQKFIQKLKDKKQTAQQQKQVYHAVSLFYEVVGPINFENVDPLENKDEKLATKKRYFKTDERHLGAGLRWVELWNQNKALFTQNIEPKTCIQLLRK